MPNRNITSLHGIRVTRIFHEGMHTYVEAEWARSRQWVTECPKCGEENPDLYGKGTGEKKLKDRPVNGGPLTIKLELPYYQCQHCNGSFRPDHEQFRENSTLTEALVRHIKRRCLGRETHSRIARRTGVDEKTVRNHFPERYEDAGFKTDSTPPRAIGVDEAHLSSVCCLIITDIGEDTEDQVIEVLPSNSGEALKRYLNRSIEPQGEVLPVVIDMTDRYRTAVQEAHIPGVVVVDRYHIVRRANWALGKTAKRLPVNDELKQRDRDLKPVGEETEDIQLTFFNRSEMDESYGIARAFRQIFETCDSRDEADRRFRQWREGVRRASTSKSAEASDEEGSLRKDFQILTETFDEWRDEILNYFDHPYTNGFNEGMNAVAKSLHQNAAGYENFNRLRLKLLRGQEPRDTR